LKKEWCCAHEGKGCENALPKPQGCSANALLTTEEKAWCCMNAGLHCQAKVYFKKFGVASSPWRGAVHYAGAKASLSVPGLCALSLMGLGGVLIMARSQNVISSWLPSPAQGGLQHLRTRRNVQHYLELGAESELGL